jgi:hypothetical protein
MLSKTIALILVTTGGAYATTEVIDQVKPQAQRDAVEYSIGLISDAAYIYNLLDNNWPQALATTVAEARSNEATTVEGTTVYWRHDDACFYAEIPTPDTDVLVQPC